MADFRRHDHKLFLRAQLGADVLDRPDHRGRTFAMNQPFWMLGWNSKKARNKTKPRTSNTLSRTDWTLWIQTQYCVEEAPLRDASTGYFRGFLHIPVDVSRNTTFPVFCKTSFPKDGRDSAPKDARQVYIEAQTDVVAEEKQARYFVVKLR